MKVLFWNIARAGGKAGTYAGDMLSNDLYALAEMYSPDIMVLCECLMNFDTNDHVLPPKYHFKRPRNRSRYRSNSTLRYALIYKDGIKVFPILLDSMESGGNRPALGIRVQTLTFNFDLIAIHAASITQSNTVQLGQIEYACKQFAGKGHMAEVIIGDMNIDIRAHRDEVVGTLDQTDLAGYVPRCTKEGTHRSRGGGFISKLDWALIHPALSASSSLRLVKAKKNEGANKRSDRSWKSVFENEKNSDHRPILLTVSGLG